MPNPDHYITFKSDKKRMWSCNMTKCKVATYLCFAEPTSLTAMACLGFLPEKMKTMNERVSSTRRTRCESSCAVMQFHLVWERIKSWFGIAHQDNQPECHSHFCAVWHTRVSVTACQHPHTHNWVSTSRRLNKIHLFLHKGITEC